MFAVYFLENDGVEFINVFCILRDAEYHIFAYHL